MTISCLLFAMPVNSQQITTPDFGEKPKKASVFAMPKTVFGVMSGVALGVPVNISKSMVKFTFDMQDSISQNFSFSDEPDFYAKSMSTVLAIPYGVLGGIAYGTIKGVENGIIKGSASPFSKESFSLTEE